MDSKPHECGEWFCESCKSWIEEAHLCYLFRDKPKSMSDSFIFFDFETTQDTVVQCQRGYQAGSCPECQGKEPCIKCKRCQNCSKPWCGQHRHVPNYVVAQTACSYCFEHTLDARCSWCGSRCPDCNAFNADMGIYKHEPCQGTCGLRETIFQGHTTLDDFGQWLFQPAHKGCTVLAHNMKGYDGVFLLEYLINNSIRPSKIIYNGSKIMYMEVQKGLNIRVLDSLNFLSMKLADLPKAFGLKEMCKGYCPHFFNKRENQCYVGSYSHPCNFGADYMSKGDRAAFLTWYQDKIDNGAIFDFKKEMEAYCRSDVDILCQACLQFRQFLNVDPFHYITIASVCMGIYKMMFLEENYIAILQTPDGDETKWVPAKLNHEGWRVLFDGVWEKMDDLRDYAFKVKKRLDTVIAQVPSAGYVQKDNYSKASIQWLQYLVYVSGKERSTIEIEHALNGGEKRIFGANYKVDGYCASTNTVYEYHGCIWHGCNQCYLENRQTTKTPRTNQSLAELHALTMIKKAALQQRGYKYACIWEHDWLKQKMSDPEVTWFVSQLDLQDRLDPRDSFFGGRTNASKLYYEIKDEEKIKYVDFTSLYPYVNKYSKYPVGHPEIITTDFKSIKQYFGLAKVKILPPRGLYHPVLPYRSCGKLKFPLCRTCADEESIVYCSHTDDQRAIVGTWCTPEIKVALSKGYTVMKLYEVYHWSETSQYNSEKKEGGLFAQYVNTFLKFKQEPSDWPDWCQTDSDKDAYVREYFDTEGVKLDPAQITKNPGLRALAKLCLNSFWGKFGQRLNQGQSQYFHDSEMDGFFQTLTDSTKTVIDFHIINEENIQLEWEHQSGFIPEDMKTNIFLATFTTCWARLKLFEVLDKLGERVLYYDTDSVIYVSRPGTYDPPLGDYLGELTDELQSGDYIMEFVSGGPKNYAYSTSTN